MRVAVSAISNNLLPQPDELPGTSYATSQVAPAVICRQFESPYDCLVAFVPLEKRDLQVYVRRFDITTTSTRYQVDWDQYVWPVAPGGIVTVRTGSRIAGWYSGGYFFLAVRSATEGQPTRILRSPDGQTWYEVSGSWDASLNGPTAVGWAFADENRLITVKE